MKHLAWIGIVAATAGAAIASCIPDFEFSAETGGPPDAGADGPVVACGAGDASALCAPGQVCCFHTDVAGCDMCSDTESCVGTPECMDAGSYAVLRCNNAEDCAADKDCCMTYTAMGAIITPQGSQCQPDCSSSQFPMCDLDDGGCPPDAGCHDVNYPGYLVCY